MLGKVFYDSDFRTKVRWRFRKILLPSQNIWTILFIASNIITCLGDGKFWLQFPIEIGYMSKVCNPQGPHMYLQAFSWDFMLIPCLLQNSITVKHIKETFDLGFGSHNCTMHCCCQSDLWNIFRWPLLTAYFFESGPMPTPWKFLDSLPVIPSCKLGQN